MSLHRYVDAKQTYYPRPRQNAEAASATGNTENGRDQSTSRRPVMQNLLSSEQRFRLQSFVDRFDAIEGLEPALRLVASELQTFFPFQACKILQRITKRFGNTPRNDPRVQRLVERCASTMSGADGVSISRALWSVGKMGIRGEVLAQLAAARIPQIICECGPITMATIWNAFEVLEVESDTCLSAMADEVLRRLDECDPPEIAIVMHAAAQLKFPNREPLFTALVPYVRERADTFSTRHLAVCIHAAARAEFRDDLLCHTVCNRFIKDMANVDALALTSAVYACGLLLYFHKQFFEAVADYLYNALCGDGRGTQLESQKIANIVYAFGKVGFYSERTMQAVVEAIVADFWRFKAQELDNITYAFALLKYRNEVYLTRLVRHLLDDGRVDKLDSQSLVSMAYSFALLGHAHPPVLRAIGDRAIPRLPNFKPEEFSILVYSLGVLSFRHHDLLTAVVEQAPAVFPRFSTQNISNLLHGLGLVTFDRDDDFVIKVASHLATRLPECSGQDIANPVTALMRMTIRHDDLLQAIASYLTSSSGHLRIRDFTTQEIANTVYAFDAMQVLHTPMFDEIANATVAKLDEFIPQEVANVIWAFSKQGFGSDEWFEVVLSRCAPHAENLQGASSEHALSVLWCGEDLEKPLAALRHKRDVLPSYARLEAAFRKRFLSPIRVFLSGLAPQRGFPPPTRYQQEFASWDLYQVGPDFTQELLEAVGICRTSPSRGAELALLDHYMRAADSMFSRYGERLLISVLPAARWLSSFMSYRLEMRGSDVVFEGTHVVEPAHPNDNDEASQRRFKTESWKDPPDLIRGPFRPVLLSTFLGNWRHRHTEIIALDLVVDLALGAVDAGKWTWAENFWQGLQGEVELFVPHTPCLSCVGAFAQLHTWSPDLSLKVAYYDWREWRVQLLEIAGRRKVPETSNYT